MTRRSAAGVLGRVGGLAVLLVFPLILACGPDGGTVRSEDIGTEETTTTTTSTSTSSIPTTRGTVVTTTRASTPRTTEPSD